MSEEDENVTPKKRQKTTNTGDKMHLMITGYKAWVNNYAKEETDRVSLTSIP
jgi:pentose-5-phosphate-3-epimerase